MMSRDGSPRIGTEVKIWGSGRGRQLRLLKAPGFSFSPSLAAAAAAMDYNCARKPEGSR